MTETSSALKSLDRYCDDDFDSTLIEQCRQPVDVPMCPYCGYQFIYKDMYPGPGAAEDRFKNVVWDPTQFDYRHKKYDGIACPRCQEIMGVIMSPPDPPEPLYRTYLLVAHTCETCGESHNFCIEGECGAYILLRDFETGHWQTEARPKEE